MVRTAVIWHEECGYMVRREVIWHEERGYMARSTVICHNDFNGHFVHWRTHSAWTKISFLGGLEEPLKFKWWVAGGPTCYFVTPNLSWAVTN